MSDRPDVRAAPAEAAEAARAELPLFRRAAMDAAGSHLYGDTACTRGPRLALVAAAIAASACACAAFATTLQAFRTSIAPLTRVPSTCATGRPVAVAGIAPAPATMARGTEFWSAEVPLALERRGSSPQRGAWHARTRQPRTSHVDSIDLIEACSIDGAPGASDARLRLRFAVRGAADMRPDGGIVAIWRDGPAP